MRMALRLLRVALVAAALAWPATGALAAPDGPADPAAVVDEATLKHTEVLSGLLATLPEEARAGLEKAIAASRKGHDAALAALARAGAAAADGDPESAGSGRMTSGLRGLERARERVAAGFEKSVATLQGLFDRLPEEATAHVTAALDRVQEHRQAALDNLDRLIAGLRPEGAAALRPDRPDRGGRPEGAGRPDLPDRPERPSIPERPAMPERPEAPERPEPPVPGR
jgi:hypothetical protein